MFTSSINTAPATPANQAAEVLDLIRAERAKSVSVREWKHRLVGYGYAVRHTGHGDVIAKLTSKEEICTVPAELLH